MIVKKVLRSLPPWFVSKVSIVKKAKDLNTLIMDELHELLTAYVMRILNDKSLRKETTFKAF